MKIIAITKPIALIALIISLSGCAGGLYLSPGTATGTAAGAVIGAVTNGGRGVLPGAIIGGAAGAVIDSANGRPAIVAPQPRYGYDDDYAARQRYEERRRFEEQRRREEARRIWEMQHPVYWDSYCGCWRR